MVDGMLLFPERYAEIIAENYEHFDDRDYDTVRSRVL